MSRAAQPVETPPVRATIIIAGGGFAGVMTAAALERIYAFNTGDPRGNVWAIAGWRNVIDGYTLNGAVTEINAECVAALRAAGHLAENVGDTSSDARRIRHRIGAHPRCNARTSAQSAERIILPQHRCRRRVHTDVTGDQIFPVMFRACDEDTGFRIIGRLNARDFWTPAGLRTISEHDARYDPAGNIGLLGGVWPGLTWWYAFASARYHPEFMVQALSASFKHYSADPKTNNTVPGQFGEYFDGESLINRGMRLSPWEPPRFLWAAVEGVCGIMLTTGAPRVKPLVPATWKWLALKRLPYHGEEITYFATRERGTFRLSATSEIESEFELERFDKDVSRAVHVLSDDATVVALASEDEISILVGNVVERTTTAVGHLTAPRPEGDVRRVHLRQRTRRLATRGTQHRRGCLQHRALDRNGRLPPHLPPSIRN